MLGAFMASKPAAIFAASGVIFGAAYMLWVYKRVFFGPLENDANKNLPDLTKLEWGYLLPMVVMAVWMGIYPGSFLRKMDASVDLWLKNAQARKLACLELENRSLAAVRAAAAPAAGSVAPALEQVTVPPPAGEAGATPPGVAGPSPVQAAVPPATQH
jgi:hypothetical protein